MQLFCGTRQSQVEQMVVILHFFACVIYLCYFLQQVQKKNTKLCWKAYFFALVAKKYELHILVWWTFIQRSDSVKFNTWHCFQHNNYLKNWPSEFREFNFCFFSVEWVVNYYIIIEEVSCFINWRQNWVAEQELMTRFNFDFNFTSWKVPINFVLLLYFITNQYFAL